MLQQGQLVTAGQAAHQLQRAVQGLGVACGLSLQLGGRPAQQALAAVGGGLPGRLGLVGVVLVQPELRLPPGDGEDAHTGSALWAAGRRRYR